MTANVTAHEASYRFGLFELDSRHGELRKQGRRIRLRGRPFDILVLLLGRGGELITREELRQELWAADTFVDFDHGLNSAVNRLREALGDSAEHPRFIETLPKRGYRFIAPITVSEPPASPAPAADAADPALPPLVDPSAPASESPPLSARPVSTAARYAIWVATGALVAAVVLVVLYVQPSGPAHPPPGKMTLAVLPFENLSNDSDQDFFSDGFTEEMIAELGKLDPDRLGVIARTTTKLYKNSRKNIGQIRQELGVDYVLEGSIRRAGSRVRITAQLIQASNMTHLWAESYDRDVADVLAIQREVAMRISKSLALALNRSAAGRTGPGSTSSSAHELYLRGRFFRDQATEESTRKAIQYFQRAIETDPYYARAYAGLADAYCLLGSPGWEVDRPGLLLQKAQANAERALTIDPQSAEAHAVLSLVQLMYRWDRAGSEREIQAAIRLNPSFAQAHQYYSTTLMTLRRFDEAIAEARRALELDPLSVPASTTLAIRYYYASRPVEATAQFLKTLDTNPEFGVAHWGLAQCYRQRGESERELDELQRAVELSGNSAYMRAHLAYGFARSGNRGRAISIQQELAAEGRERYASPYHQALIAAGLDDRVTMLHWLERAFADQSGWMVFLPFEPEFDGVRQMPEFHQLLARVKPMS
jgi:TolB-like protein/DNA-binding winged helix-turn-helix (wHTH) protein/Tfp pilus assembly protein PilF